MKHNELKEKIEMLADDIVKYFHRHLIPMLFTFQVGNQVSRFLVTTFAFSVSGRWFLITAGHCITTINELIGTPNHTLLGCQLFDGGGEGATNFDPIPFPFNKSTAECLSDNQAYDYGVIKLSPLYVELLKTNNIVPLNEETWKRPPEQAQTYWLLGIPEELVKCEGNVIEYLPSLHPIRRLSERPAGFAEVDAPQFYGQIKMDSKVASIMGMSGGPVFAFQENNEGELRCFLAAIQSRWLPDSHYIAACPAQLLGNFLEHMIATEEES